MRTNSSFITHTLYFKSHSQTLPKLYLYVSYVCAKSPSGLQVSRVFGPKLVWHERPWRANNLICFYLPLVSRATLPHCLHPASSRVEGECIACKETHMHAHRDLDSTAVRGSHSLIRCSLLSQLVAKKEEKCFLAVVEFSPQAWLKGC